MALRQWLQAYLGLTAIQQRRGRKMVTEPVKHREEYNDYCNWCDDPIYVDHDMLQPGSQMCENCTINWLGSH